MEQQSAEREGRGTAADSRPLASIRGSDLLFKEEVYQVGGVRARDSQGHWARSASERVLFLREKGAVSGDCAPKWAAGTHNIYPASAFLAGPRLANATIYSTMSAHATDGPEVHALKARWDYLTGRLRSAVSPDIRVH